MSASNEDPRAPDIGPNHLISISSWLTFFGAFTFIYILSTGPAAKLYQRGVIPEAAMYIYAPLDFFYQNSPPARRALDWYVEDVWHAK